MFSRSVLANGETPSKVALRYFQDYLAREICVPFYIATCAADFFVQMLAMLPFFRAVRIPSPHLCLKVQCSLQHPEQVVPNATETF